MKNLILFVLFIICIKTVDAQKADIVFATAKYANFSEAKAHAVNQVKDGDPLWLYIKLDKPLKNYVVKNEYANPAKPYALVLEIGPKGESATSFMSDEKYFSDADLSKQELVYNLAPGISGADNASQVFLNVIAGSRANPGVWENELRVSANKSGDKKIFGTTPITFNVPDGIRLYKNNNTYFPYIFEKGVVKSNVIPQKGFFKEADAIAAMKKAVDATGIKYKNFIPLYNMWNEDYNARKGGAEKRTAQSAFFYTKNGKCYFGLAWVDQFKESGKWGSMKAFVDPTGYPMDCN